jgi:2-iminobutanoate/2-iminopropanoate deaminase
MERINPESVWKPKTFVQATANGAILITSGVTGRDRGGKIVSESFAEQARQAFQNIKNIVASQGRALDDVMKLTVYVKDIRFGQEYQRVMDEFFHPDKRPASTFVAISSLWDERLLIEMEAIVDLS